MYVFRSCAFHSAERNLILDVKSISGLHPVCTVLVQGSIQPLYIIWRRRGHSVSVCRWFITCTYIFPPFIWSFNLYGLVLISIRWQVDNCLVSYEYWWYCAVALITWEEPCFGCAIGYAFGYAIGHVLAMQWGLHLLFYVVLWCQCFVMQIKHYNWTTERGHVAGDTGLCQLHKEACLNWLSIPVIMGSVCGPGELFEEDCYLP